MVSFTPLPLYSREELLWGPRTGLDILEKREILAFAGNLNHNLSFIQPGA